MTVPDKTYIHFLNFIGEERRQARPATVPVTFHSLSFERSTADTWPDRSGPERSPLTSTETPDRLAADASIGSGTISNRGPDGGPGKPIDQGGVGYSCIAEVRVVALLGGLMTIHVAVKDGV